jgi:hypothetical protein
MKVLALAERAGAGAIYVLCWVYWLWLAFKVGSFGMFAFGFFFPLAIAAAILGLWSLLFEMPSWLPAHRQLQVGYRT